MSNRNAPSILDCPSCVTGIGHRGANMGEIVAIKNANACNDNPECRCGCHALWADLSARRVPIGKKP